MVANDQKVYRVIAENQGVILPYWRIAKLVNIDTRTVARRVKCLIKNGLIRALHNQRPAGGKEAYSFKVLREFPVEESVTQVSERITCYDRLHELFTELCQQNGSITRTQDWIASQVPEFSFDHVKRTLSRMVKDGVLGRTFNFTPNEYGHTQQANTYTLRVAYRSDNLRHDKTPRGDASPKRSLLSFKSLSNSCTYMHKKTKDDVVDTVDTMNISKAKNAIREKLGIEATGLTPLLRKYIQLKSLSYVIEKIELVASFRSFRKGKLPALISAIVNDYQVESTQNSRYQQNQKVKRDLSSLVLQDNRYDAFYNLYPDTMEPEDHEEKYAAFFNLFPSESSAI